MDKNTKIVVDSEWLDNDTFVVHFEPQSAIENGEEILNEVVVEYHKDENCWVAQEQAYSLDGDFLDSIDLERVKTPYEVAEYMTIAEGAFKKFHTESSWEDIVVADDYEKYDALVDSIRNYYASFHNDSDEVANDVEDIINTRFIELLSELDKKYK